MTPRELLENEKKQFINELKNELNNIGEEKKVEISFFPKSIFEKLTGLLQLKNKLANVNPNTLDTNDLNKTIKEIYAIVQAGLDAKKKDDLTSEEKNLYPSIVKKIVGLNMKGRRLDAEQRENSKITTPSPVSSASITSATIVSAPAAPIDNSIIKSFEEWMAKKNKMDADIPLTWSNRDKVYDQEKELLSKISLKLLEDCKTNINQCIQIMQSLHTDRARLNFFQEVFKNLNQNDANIIKDNLPHIVACFRSSDEFLISFEKLSHKNKDIKLLVHDIVNAYYEDLNNLVDNIYKKQKALSEITPHEIDLLGSDRRCLIGVFNFLDYDSKQIFINMIAGKLENSISDRYDWFNLLGGCQSEEEVNQLYEVISLIFEKNPKLTHQFSEENIKKLITDVNDQINNWIKTINPADKLREEKKYALHFSNGLSYHLLGTSNFEIERNVQAKDIANDAMMGEGKLTRRQSVIFKNTPVAPLSDNDKEANAQKRLYQLADMGRDYRNENINFLPASAWTAQRYNIGIPIVQRHPEDYVKDILGRIAGYNPATSYYRPYTSGNCWDQAVIQLVYLATTPQNDSTLKDRTVMMVASPHANHVYPIVTKLSIDEINAMPRNQFGRVDLLALFKKDKDAVLVDAWRMAVLHKPLEGLHYGAGNNKFSDPTDVEVISICKIGEPNTMRINVTCDIFDENGKAQFDDSGNKLGQEQIYQLATYNFHQQFYRLLPYDPKNPNNPNPHEDIRWKQHRELLEGRPVREEVLQKYFENKPAVPLETYRPVYKQ